MQPSHFCINRFFGWTIDFSSIDEILGGDFYWGFMEILLSFSRTSESSNYNGQVKCYSKESSNISLEKTSANKNFQPQPSIHHQKIHVRKQKNIMMFKHISSYYFPLNNIVFPRKKNHWNVLRHSGNYVSITIRIFPSL